MRKMSEEGNKADKRELRHVMHSMMWTVNMGSTTEILLRVHFKCLHKKK